MTLPGREDTLLGSEICWVEAARRVEINLDWDQLEEIKEDPLGVAGLDLRGF